MTSDEQAFIAGIIANRADDAPRLVYADWLEEHGQGERAEFIRVQCRLAEIGRDAVEMVGNFQVDHTAVRQRPIEPLTINRDMFVTGMVDTGMIPGPPGPPGEIGRLAREYAFPLRFGEYEGRAVVSGSYPVRQLARVRFALLPQMSGGEIKPFWPCDEEAWEARKRLRKLELDLLSRNVLEWGSELCGAKLASTAWGQNRSLTADMLRVFQRGFVTNLTLLWSDWLTHADAILAVTPLERVELTTMPPRMSGYHDRQRQMLQVWFSKVTDQVGSAGVVREVAEFTLSEVLENYRNRTIPVVDVLSRMWPGIMFTLPHASTWTGASGNMDASDPANWSAGQVLQAGDMVVIGGLPRELVEGTGSGFSGREIPLAQFRNRLGRD